MHTCRWSKPQHRFLVNVKSLLITTYSIIRTNQIVNDDWKWIKRRTKARLSEFLLERKIKQN